MGKFYVTTPIYYVNDVPSIGHAYTTTIADILTRWHRLKGEKTFFLTGLDENSQITVKAAKEKGFKDFKKYTDEMAEKWKKAWKELSISNDGFIRTTESRHKKVVTEFFEKINKKGDIYKGNYVGLYCDSCEAYFTEKDLENGLCPFHKKPPKEISEENYFFKLAAYKEKVLAHIEKNPDFIQPKSRRNEVVSFLKGEVKDVSVSRPGKEWGITLPIDNSQKIWVWFDALINYVSGSEGNWPAELHLLAKDILRFHCVIWPAMLMSAGYELPKKLFVHGFLTINGQKMSKSLGNVIDPLYLKEKYGLDVIRYYIAREIPFGEDGDFSEKSLRERLNNELANELGNLVNRAIVMLEKYSKGEIPEAETDKALQKKLDLKKIEGCMERLELHHALAEIFSFVAACNQFVNEKQPWKLKGKELDTVLYSLADSIRIVSILLQPFMPSTSEKINQQLGVKQGLLKECKFNLLKAGTRVRKGEVLFRKVE
jgi:methionyl-tRNA synthetase